MFIGFQSYVRLVILGQMESFTYILNLSTGWRTEAISPMILRSKCIGILPYIFIQRDGF